MKRPRKNDGEFSQNVDITGALRGWTFQPGQVNVRLVHGCDGKPKLQLRLDLGLLQMELDGRPDGKRPHRAASELEFQMRKLRTHENRFGTNVGYALTPRDCQALRDESSMFYHRYLSLFVLEQYPAVIRDTQHNLDVMDLCSNYGRSEFDRNCLEQYRPYVLMMNIRAQACEALQQGFVQTAIAFLRGGIRKIARLMPRDGRRDMLRHSHEAHILLDMIRQIRAQLPPDPRSELQVRLRAALAHERYEEAADLRDRLMAMTTAMALPHVTARRAAKAKRRGESQPSELPPNPGTPPTAAERPKRTRKPRHSNGAGPDATA